MSPQTVLSVVAVAISVAAIFNSTRHDRVQRLTQTHQALNDPFVQDGRKHLHREHRLMDDPELGWSEVKTERPEVWSAINNSLAAANLMAYYHVSGWLPRWKRGRWGLPRREPAMLDIWGPVLVGLAEPTASIVNWRSEHEGWGEADGPLSLLYYLRVMIVQAESQLK